MSKEGEKAATRGKSVLKGKDQMLVTLEKAWVLGEVAINMPHIQVILTHNVGEEYHERRLDRTSAETKIVPPGTAVVEISSAEGTSSGKFYEAVAARMAPKRRPFWQRVAFWKRRARGV